MSSVSHAAALMEGGIKKHARLARIRRSEPIHRRRKAEMRRTGADREPCPEGMETEDDYIVQNGNLFSRIEPTPTTHQTPSHTRTGPTAETQTRDTDTDTSASADTSADTSVDADTRADTSVDADTSSSLTGTSGQAPPPKKPRPPWCVRQPLKKLMHDLRLEMVSPADHPEVGDFDQAFLVTASMRVLSAWRRDGPLQARQLPQVQEPKPRENDDTTPSTLVTPSTASLARIFELELAGERYLAFVQPTIAMRGQRATIHGHDSDPDSHLALVALVSEARLGAQSRALDANTLSVAFFFLGLALLVVPLGKLFLLGPHARYGKIDAGLLFGAILFSALLAVVAGLTFYAHHRLDARHTAQMKTTLDKVEGLLDSQIVAASTQLKIFQRKYGCDSRTFASKTASPHTSVPYVPCETKVKFNAKNIDSWCNFTEHQYRTPDDLYDKDQEPTGSGYFRGAQTIERSTLREDNTKLVGDYSIVGISSEGNPVYRLSSRPDNTAIPVALASRDYFQRASKMRTRMLTSKNGASADGHHRVASLQLSENTADYILVVAEPILPAEATKTEAAREENPCPVVVHSLATNMPLLASELVLPEDYTIAVLRRDGQTLYHSELDKRSRHGYNFYESITNDDALRAAMRARVEDDLETSYLGKPSRIVVRYLHEQDWYLVVTAPTVRLHGVVASCIWISIVGCSFFLLIIAVLFVIFSSLLGLFYNPGPTSFVPLLLRPQRRFSRFYVVSGGLMCALSIGITWCGISLPLEAPLCWLLGLAVIAALVAALMRHPRFTQWVVERERAHVHATQTRGGIKLGRSYTCWIIGGVALLVAAPATILFANSYHAQMYLRASAALLHYAERLAKDAAIEKVNDLGSDRELARIASQFSTAEAAAGASKDRMHDLERRGDGQQIASQRRPKVLHTDVNSASTPPQTGTEPKAAKGKSGSATLGVRPTPPPPSKRRAAADDTEASMWAPRNQPFLLLSVALAHLGLNDQRNSLLWRASAAGPVHFEQRSSLVHMFVRDDSRLRAHASAPVEHILSDDWACCVVWLVLGYISVMLAAYEVARVGGRRLFFLRLLSRRVQPLSVSHVDDGAPCAPDAAWNQANKYERLLLRQLAWDTLIFLPWGPRWNPVLEALEDHGWVRIDGRTSDGLASRCSIHSNLAHYIRQRPLAEQVLEGRSDEQRIVLEELAGDGLATPHPRWQPVLEQLANDMIIHLDHLTLDPALAEELHARSPLVAPENRQAEGRSAWERWRSAIAALVLGLWGALGASAPDLLFGELLAPALIAGMAVLSKLWLSQPQGH